MAFLTPNVEIEETGSRTRRLTVYVTPVAYRDEGGVLRAIDPTWVDSGDGTRPHLVSAAPLMITVAEDGMRRLHITRELDRYVEIGAPYTKPASTWTKVNLGAPTRSAGLLTWVTTNANVYVQHKGHGVKLAILLKGGWQPPGGQFAFPVALVGLTRTGDTLFRDGVPVATVRKPHVEDFDNPEDVRTITHEFVRLQGQDYILFTLPSLTGMSRPLIDPTLDVTPDPTAGIDTELRRGSATANFGTDILVSVRDITAASGRSGLIKFDLSSIPGDATIDDATLTVFNGSVVAGTSTLTWYRILAANSAWTETGATWDHAVATTTRWAGDAASDGGADAGCTVSGTDYAAAAIGSSSWAASEAEDTQHDVVLDTTEFAAMVDANYGMVLFGSQNSVRTFRSSDYTTDTTKRPRLVVNYTLAGSTYTIVAAQGSYALTGQTTGLLASRLLTAAQGGYTLSGQTVNLLASRLLTAAQGSYTLSGQAADLLRGFTLVAAQGGYTLTGQDAALVVSRILAADQGAYTLTGQAANLLRGFLLTAAQGSYILTGQDAILTYTPGGGGPTYTIVAAQGAYVLTGQVAGLLAARLLTAAQGTYTLTGQDASLLAARSLTANQGAYALTGQDAGLRAARLLTAVQGSYSLTGQAASLLRSFTLIANQGSYALTGQAAILLATRLLAAAQGNYTLTGQDANLLAGRLLTANQGSYTLTGQAVALIIARILLASQGSYILTGQDVTFDYSGAVFEYIALTLRARSAALTLAARTAAWTLRDRD